MFRRSFSYPPVTRLALVRFESTSERSSRDAAEEAARVVTPLPDRLRLRGPAPAPLERIRNHWRWQLLLSAANRELLRELLPVLAEHVGRAAVLVIRGTGVSAWSGIGFAVAERLREWQDEVSASENLQRFADTGRPVRFSPANDPLLTRWLADDTMGSDAYLFPVCLRGKLMGAIYVDRVDGQPWRGRPHRRCPAWLGGQDRPHRWRHPGGRQVRHAEVDDSILLVGRPRKVSRA